MKTYVNEKKYFDGYLKAENFNKKDSLTRENLVSKLNEFFINTGSEQRIYEKIKNKHRSRFIRKMSLLNNKKYKKYKKL